MKELYEVWYTKTDSFREFIAGDKVPDTNQLRLTHTKVRTLRVEETAADLDDVYREMQSHNWSPNGEACLLLEYLGMTHTSMSVGDVIHRIKDDTWHVVATVGFEELHPPSKDDLLGIDAQLAVSEIPKRFDGMRIADFAMLIKKCAFEMLAHDRALIEEAHTEGRTCLVRGTASGPSVQGLDICIETARGAEVPECLGTIAYYLLAYVWNDALYWADQNID